MKAQVLYLDNAEEIENAEKLNIPLPEEKGVWHEFYFDTEYIHCACINTEGNINIFLPSGKWSLKYDKNLWNEIKEYLIKK